MERGEIKHKSICSVIKLEYKKQNTHTHTANTEKESGLKLYFR